MATFTDMYDVIGIGIGPYNLGLAALLRNAPELNAAFFDQNEKFDWHPGMLIEEMDLQVPFLADLTTFADPTSSFSYLNYLHEQNRLLQFYFLKRFEVPRNEYNDYLQWAVSKLDNLHFGFRVIDVMEEEGDNPHYRVITENLTTGKKEVRLAKHVVMGTGTEPLIPYEMSGFKDEDVLHTSRYLYEKQKLVKAASITVVGSGQSAAEVFLDLLKEQKTAGFQLNWITRSNGIFQLEKAKLGQEFFSPDYIDYFHQLSFEQRIGALDTLDSLRNGVDPETLKEIYNLLYHMTVGSHRVPVTIQPLTEVTDITGEEDGYLINCHQWQAGEACSLKTEKVILATGYKPNIPDWFHERFSHKVKWEDEKRFAVTRDYQLVFHEPRCHHFFTLTNLEHSHGTGATNLGLAVHRNIKIINLLAGRTVYEDKRHSIFQQFNKEN